MTKNKTDFGDRPIKMELSLTQWLAVAEAIQIRAEWCIKKKDIETLEVLVPAQQTIIGGLRAVSD